MLATSCSPSDFHLPRLQVAGTSHRQATFGIALRGLCQRSPHIKFTFQMLPEPMHYGWTRGPSKIEAGWEDKGSVPPPAPVSFQIHGQLPGSGGHSRANTQSFKRRSTPPPPPLSLPRRHTHRAQPYLLLLLHGFPTRKRWAFLAVVMVLLLQGARRPSGRCGLERRTSGPQSPAGRRTGASPYSQSQRLLERGWRGRSGRVGTA